MDAARAPSSPAQSAAHIAVAVALGFGLPILATAGANMLLGGARVASLPWLYLQHGIQAALALLAILAVRRFAPGGYGLSWPKGPSYVRPAILVGAAFGLGSTLVLFLIAGRMAPAYAPTLANVAGWLGFEGIFVGPTEEILFRSLIIGYLSGAVPIQIRIGRLQLSLGGLIAAAIFAFSHWGYGAMPLALAASQQAYAFALGLFYAYVFERSRSLLAPVVAHNVSDGVVALAQLGGLLIPG